MKKVKLPPGRELECRAAVAKSYGYPCPGIHLGPPMPDVINPLTGEPVRWGSTIQMHEPDESAEMEITAKMAEKTLTDNSGLHPSIRNALEHLAEREAMGAVETEPTAKEK